MRSVAESEKKQTVLIKEDGRKPVILPRYKADAISRLGGRDVFAEPGD